MFTSNTVLVLGAGASWHYGYPTGEQLVIDILRNNRRLIQFCQNRIAARINLPYLPQFMRTESGDITDAAALDRLQAQILQCEDLENRLTSVAPLVIDYFLGWNQHLHKLGQMLIAASLYERESFGAGKKNYNRFIDADSSHPPTPLSSFDFTPFSDNWIRFVVHQLLLGCRDSSDLLANNVRFITFNYDRSFESSLERMLSAVNFLKEKDIREFLGNDRIVHMYGALPVVAPMHPGTFEALTSHPSSVDWISFIPNANRLLDICWTSGEELGVVDPDTKSRPTETDLAQQYISQARKTYFLGFGFDKNNLRRLGFPSPPDMSKPFRTFAFTNMGNSLSINRRAASAFQLSQVSVSDASYTTTFNTAAERSTRDTYKAIELDFAAFEE